MKKLALLILPLLVSVPTFAQQQTPPSPEDLQVIVATLQKQRDQAIQMAQNLEVNLSLLQAKVADLQKQLDATKPKKDVKKK